MNPALVRRLEACLREAEARKHAFDKWARLAPTRWDADPSFANMGEFVWGTPPLWTTGVNGCSVLAGRTRGGEHFLVHLDSSQVEHSITGLTNSLTRGGHRKYPDPKWPVPDPPECIHVLTHDARKPRIAGFLKSYGKDMGGPKVTVSLYTYPTPEPLTVTWDGARLSWALGLPPS